MSYRDGEERGNEREIFCRLCPARLASFFLGFHAISRGNPPLSSVEFSRRACRLGNWARPPTGGVPIGARDKFCTPTDGGRGGWGRAQKLYVADWEVHLQSFSRALCPRRFGDHHLPHKDAGLDCQGFSHRDRDVLVREVRSLRNLSDGHHDRIRETVVCKTVCHWL